MNRDKLKKLGIDLPLFPTTSVGSFPKPDELKKARADFRKRAITAAQFRQKEEEATRFWVKKQEELDIDILVDGEMYRGDMVAYFAETMEGFEQGGLVRSYGNRYYHKPVIVRPVKWKGPITVDWWQFAQRQTVRPMKGMLTGPYTIMDWCFNEYYPDRRATALALAKEIRKEVEALIGAGAKIIQIDEPALSVRPEEMAVAREAVEVVTKGLPAYFVTHVCYGAFEFIYPEMLSLPFDNFDLEMSNSDLDLLRLFGKNPFTKDLSAGVVDVHSHRVEDLVTVRRRIEGIARVVSPERIWIDPDCGLKTRTVEEAVSKLQVVSLAAAEARQKWQKKAV